MEIKKKIESFCKLGQFLQQFETETLINSDLKELNDLFYDRFQDLIKKQYHYNGWFTEQNVRTAINSIAKTLNKEQLETWLSKYKDIVKKSSKRVGVIMAGNIPMVGFHDFLCVLMSGNIFIGKASSDDKYLLPFISEVLIKIEPDLKDFIFFTDSQLRNIDAVIATGSNNSSRYFDYYFGKYPHIIRKNRASVAVLNGKESEGDLENLGKDIFQYFGLGCRNVSKVYVPKGYDFDKFFKAIYAFKDVVNNNKYGNNYDYNKTIYLMNTTKLLENGFLLLKEDQGIVSPVAVLYYEYYSDKKTLLEKLRVNSSAVQCIVSNDKVIQSAVPFGKAQYPELFEYADGVDTMKFCLATI